MFVLQNAPAQPLKLSNIDIEPLELHTPTAKFDLTLVLEPNEKGMDGQIVYNTNLFEKATIDRKSTRLNSSHTDISRMPSSAWKKKKKKKQETKLKQVTMSYNNTNNN